MRLALLPVLCCVLGAQTPDSQIVFEVATVRHGAPGDYSVASRGGPGTSDPSRISIENSPLSSLIETAYAIDSYQLSGPSWLIDERFTINAKLPEGTTKAQLNLMMRNLLIERFKLAAHFEKKDAAGYQLVVAKGGEKLTPSPGAPDAPDPDDPSAKSPDITVDREGYPVLPKERHYRMAIANGRVRFHFVDESMDQFARELANRLHKPVTNTTGLGGKYDFDLFWSYSAMGPDAPPDSGPTAFAAIQQQLGLKLESKKVPADLLTVDHVERRPTEN